MYVNSNRRRRGVLRGFGDIVCDELQNCLNTDGSTSPASTTTDVPCMPTGSAGALQVNQVWCATGTQTPPPVTGASTTPNTTGTNILDTLLSAAQGFFPTNTASAGASCFTPSFPWIGTNQAGVCVPALNIPAPWGTLITVGLVSFLVIGLVKKK